MSLQGKDMAIGWVIGWNAKTMLLEFCMALVGVMHWRGRWIFAFFELQGENAAIETKLKTRTRGHENTSRLGKIWCGGEKAT